jgi:two-component system sensor histidine kinase YesM
VPIIGTGLFFYAYSSQRIRDELILQNRNTAERIRDVADTHVRQLYLMMLNLARDEKITAFLYEKHENVINSFELFEIVNDLDLLHRMITSFGYIRSMYLYSPHNGFILTTDGANDADTFSDIDWLTDFERNREKRKLWYLNRHSLYGEDLLTVFWNLYEFDRLNGAVVINIDVDEFAYLFESRDDIRPRFLFYDEEEHVFFSNEPQHLGSFLAESGVMIPAEDRSDLIGNYQDEEAAVSIAQSRHFSFSVLTLLPLDDFYRSLADMRRILISMLVLGSIGVLILSFIVSVRVFQPVRNIMKHLEELNAFQESGEGRSVVVGHSEVKYIANTISRIVASDQEKESELKKRIELLKKAQARALQSQINPHFLYNTLEGIKWTIMGLLKQDNPAAQMITNLSKLLRYSQDNEDSIARIRDEIENAALYLDIMQDRYKNKFKVEWNIDSTILDYRIVRLSLQPILENAIYHGIKPLKKKCSIAIKGFLQNNEIQIDISDDGKGLEEEEINEINRGLMQDFLADNRHIGLRNVNQRLKLMFGEQYGLFLSKQLPSGITVRLLIPCIEAEK